MCILGDDSGEGNEADEVGNGHEAVGDIGKVPRNVTLGDGAANEDNDAPEDAVWGDETMSTEVFERFFAEVGPPEQGGDGEG